MVGTSDTLTITNTQASPVTGQVRLIPDANTSAMPPVTFSLPAEGSQAFPNLLATFGPITAPAILAVESSDTVRLSSIPLRIAYPERPLTIPVRFNPSAPSTGTLVLGILSGLVRVNIYEHPASGTPLVTRTMSSSGEQVTRLRYADLLPAGVAISDGSAVITPLSGQAIAVSLNAPTRRRAAGAGPINPQPVLSITGSPACEFTTGVHASVPPVAGAIYRWTLFNAAALAVIEHSIDLSLGGAGYSTLVLELAAPAGAATAEANIRIVGKPDASLSVPAAVPPNTTFTASMPAGAETYQWQLAGSGSILSGATSTVITILSGASGTLTITGSAQNGTCTATDTKVVAISPPTPAISNVSLMPNPVRFGGLAAIEFTTSNTTSWAISSAIGNGFTSDPPHAGSGDGAHFVIYSASNNDGQETMTITATGPGGQTTQTLSFLVSDNAPNTPPTISSVAATNTPSGLTLSYTLSGANYWVIDPPACSPGSGRGSGTFTVQCSATRFSEQFYSAYGIGNTGYDGGSVLTVYVSAPSSIASNTTFTASMGPNHSGYNWSVSNGTILSGQGTQTATIRAGAAGTPLTIRGTASSGACCTAIDMVTVTVNP